MKRFSKIMFLLLAIIAVHSSFAVVSYANSYDIQPYWTVIDVISGSIDISSSGLAYVEVGTTGFQCDKMSITIDLQQKKGVTWSTLKSWSNTSNYGGTTISGSYQVTKGYSYRAVATVKGYQNGVLKETVNQTFDYGYFS